MKKLSILPFLALLIAVAASAFTVTDDAKGSDSSTFNNWYEYRGPLPASEDDLTDESNYFLVDGPVGCNSDQQICAIQVAGSGQHPTSFSSQVEGDILQADQSKLPTPGYIEMKP